ncbi:MAG: glycosyltransferase [Bacteroidales bacterium]|nr:glycosyltransferase [Bacteroidales bacterium]
MNITIICEVFGEANNGTTIAALNLISYLKKKGHNVKVVCPDEDKRGLEGYYILPKQNLGALINWRIRVNDIVLAKFDRKIIYEAVKDADIVHVMLPLFTSRRTSKYIEKLGIPITAGFHAQAENFSNQIAMQNVKLVNKLIYHWYDGNIFRRAQAIHYPTQFIRDIFENEIKRKTNGYVISNGVNKMFKPKPGPKPEQFKDKYCILFTGRLSAEKSHMVLLEAVHKSKYNDKIQLIFAGNGRTEAPIRKYSAKHLVNQPVVDFFSREKLLEIINFCDLYCHPAEVEIEAIACLEAISCGLVPVIANSPKCATKGFAIDERSLFKVNDSTDLARKIDYFIEHPEEKAELSSKYLKESVNYDQDECMRQMEEMFLKEIEKHKNSCNLC